MAIDHFSRAKKAWPLLVKRAKGNPPLSPYTYKEISEKLELHHRAASWFLSEIQEFCRENKLPPLQALVVNKKTRLPGHGYYGSKIDHTSHKKALEEVSKVDWTKIKFQRKGTR